MPPERPARAPSTKNPLVLINPEIVAYDDTPSIYDEGCLSIPDYYAEVERPAGCTIEYLDRNGEKQTLKADGPLRPAFSTKSITSMARSSSITFPS